MNVKAGDLAIVIKSRKMRAVGKVCRVICTTPGYEGWWQCEFSEPVETLEGLSSIADVRDDWLRPISGLPDTQDIDQDIKEPA